MSQWVITQKSITLLLIYKYIAIKKYEKFEKTQNALNWFLMHYPHVLSHSLPHPPPAPFFFSPSLTTYMFHISSPTLHFSLPLPTMSSATCIRHGWEAQIELCRTTQIGARAARTERRCTSRRAATDWGSSSTMWIWRRRHAALSNDVQWKAGDVWGTHEASATNVIGMEHTKLCKGFEVAELYGLMPNLGNDAREAYCHVKEDVGGQVAEWKLNLLLLLFFFHNHI